MDVYLALLHLSDILALSPMFNDDGIIAAEEVAPRDPTPPMVDDDEAGSRTSIASSDHRNGAVVNGGYGANSDDVTVAGTGCQDIEHVHGTSSKLMTH